MGKKNKNLNERLMEKYKKEELMQAYKKIEENYKKFIKENPDNSINERNLLAYTHFNMGRVDEAKKELEEIIKKYESYMAYRQLIYIEHMEGNLDNAKLWAYECLDRFPKNTGIVKCVEDLEKEKED